MWITTCIAAPVLENRHLKYVFRAQPYGTQWGLASTEMLTYYSKEQFGKDPKDLKVAIIHEDGAYGTDVARGNVEGATKGGLQVVMNEGYSVTSPDLSSLVTKLKRAKPDVILHTGYNPDISLFLRQAREGGLRFQALVGHGAGYTDYNKLKAASGTDVNFFMDVDPISIWEVKPEAIQPQLRPLVQMVGDAYQKARPDTVLKSAHVGMAASNTYLFLTNVLPRAIKTYGGIDAEALRKAALDTDVPDGGTMLGFGAKFEPVESVMAGQNNRAYPVVIQYIDDKSYVVWPKALQQRPPVLKLPDSSPYAAK
jgi:branched-chain amino acid transport system substrate-binding protein